MVDWQALDQTYLMSTYRRLPIAIAKGEGKSYLDLFTGLAVNILGHSHPQLFHETRGKGMMVGIPLNLPAEQVSHLQKALLQDGILVDVTQKTIVRLLPPLTLTKAEVDRFMDTFTDLLSDITQGRQV